MERLASVCRHLATTAHPHPRALPQPQLPTAAPASQAAADDEDWPLRIRAEGTVMQPSDVVFGGAFIGQEQDVANDTVRRALKPRL